MPVGLLLYHFSVHPLAQQTLRVIRSQNLLRAGDRLAVAVSGGADSVALLGLMLELREEIGLVLSVAHVNHKLRGKESDDDAEFVQKIAQQHGLEFHTEFHSEAGLISRGLENRKCDLSNVEANARYQRYAFFRELARDGKVSKIATAHTLDDQAETMLLRIFRGTGVRGLSGIHPRVIFEDEGRPFGEVVRPLLHLRRSSMHEFLREQGQSWREDSSNSNLAFDRNRVRHRLLPVIAREFGDASIEHMSELAEIARAEDEHWDSTHPEVRPEGRGRLAIEQLLRLPLAAQRRLVRQWLEINIAGVDISFRLIAQVLSLPAEPAHKPLLQLSSGWSVRFEKNELRLERSSRAAVESYAYKLPVPGKATIPELALRFEVLKVEVSSVPEVDRKFLLNLELMPNQLLLRNWTAGDRYWPANTSAAKKIKDLLTDRKIKGDEKRSWPVAEAEGRGIIWMRGFVPPAELQVPKGATSACWIREFPANS